MQMIQNIDAAVMLLVQEHVRCGVLTPVMQAASRLGNDGLIWLTLAAVLLSFGGTRRAGFDLLLCIGVPWVITEFVLKNLIARPRPYLSVEGLEILIEQLSSYSCPSGHACSSFAAATALALAFRGRGGAWAFLPAALIAASRVYVGVHYATDVLLGAAIGTAGAFLTYRLLHRYLKSDLRPRQKGI